MGAFGDATAVWGYYNVTGPGPSDVRHEVHSTRFEPSFGWQDAVLHTNATGRSGFNPAVAHGAQGEVVIVWEEREGGTSSIVAARRDPIYGWGTNVALQFAVHSSLYRPRVAISPAGDAHVVWQGWDGARNRVFWASYSPLDGWRTPLAIDDGGPDSYYPEVAVGHNGTVLVAWYEGTGGPTNIRASRYEPGFDWQAPIFLETSDFGDAFNPVVGIDGAGSALAVWQQYDGGRWGIWAATSASGGLWQTPVQLDFRNRDAHDASLAVGFGGIAVAAWTYDTGVRGVIQANRFEAGTWIGPRDLSANLRGSGHHSRVVVDASGVATVVWLQTNETATDVYASRSNASGSWDSPVKLDTGAFGGVAPGIAVDGRGNVIAAWQTGLPGSTVHASRHAGSSGTVPDEVAPGGMIDYALLLFLAGIAVGAVSVIPVGWFVRRLRRPKSGPRTGTP